MGGTAKNRHRRTQRTDASHFTPFDYLAIPAGLMNPSAVPWQVAKWMPKESMRPPHRSQGVSLTLLLCASQPECH